VVSEIDRQYDRYPWLGWAVTGVLTLAGVLVFGLVMSAQHPPAQPGPPNVSGTLRVPASSGTRSVPDTMLASGAQSKPDTIPRPSAALAVSAPSASAAKPAPPPPSPRPIVAEIPAVIELSAVPADSAKPVPARKLPDPPVQIAQNPALAEVAPPHPVAPRPSASPPATSSSGALRPTVSSAKQPAPDAAKRAAYAKAVADVRKAMSQRDLATAKKRLKAAADNAQGPAEQDEVERLETIQDYLEQFWDGVRNAVAAMQATEEIVLSESNRVSVIESSRKELVVQMYGRPRRYRIEMLPMDLLSAIAKASFKPTPGSKLVVGSFLAVDAHGDRNEAKKLWREAIAAGEKDGKLLLPELDAPRPKSPPGSR
jgi:hypothetical protein